MKNENEFDQFFKTGLGDPEIPFNKLDWEKMENLLNSQQKKPMVPLWVYTVSGIAAALIIVMFWLLSDTQQPIPAKTVVKLKANVKPLSPQTPDTKTPYQAVGIKDDTGTSTKKHAVVRRFGKMDAIPNSIDSAGQSFANIKADQMVLDAVIKNSTNTATIETTTVADAVISPTAAEATAVVPVKEMSAIKPITKESKSPLSLTLVIAPDISRVSSGLNSKLSSNFGVLVNYLAAKKLGITTGVVYAKKYYNYAGINKGAYGNADKPWEVDADCDVLDIPLNASYSVYSKKNISISLNTGLSSYFMLKEKYKYINQDQNGTNISTLVIDNKNQHLFGVANFSVSFEHKVSQKLSIGLQPFYKVPLTGIGYHNSNLNSKGVAFSLTLNK
ncbi:porin family protein [Pedobacter sp. PWIIR3]